MTNKILETKQRFVQVRNKLNLSQAELALAIKSDKTAISKIENPKEIKRGPTLSIMMAMAEVFGINRHYIESGIGEMFVNQSNPRLEARPTRLYADPMDFDDKTEKVINLPDGTVVLRVPIVPERAYAGYMRGFADPEYYDDLEDILIGVDKEPNGTYIGFEVVGDSMICLDTVELAEESIFPGRIAIGRDLPADSWKTRLHTHNYKNWIFVHKTEGILIKQIVNHDVVNGTITIHSLNPKYKDETLKLEDMQQIFSVIQIVQRTRPKMK
jgi:DNA-binding XRE family transcriptional regulator